MNSFLFLILMTSGLAYADRSDVIVHLAIVDHFAFHPRDVAARTRKLATLYPGARVAEVLLKTTPAEHDDPAWRARARDQIRDGLATALPDDARVRALVLSLHGSGSFLRSNLSFMGSLLNGGPDPKLRATLGPLHQKLAPDARVVLLSCNIINCGRAVANRRVEAFMLWLGATDGTLVAFEDRLVTNFRSLFDLDVRPRWRQPLASLAGTTAVMMAVEGVAPMKALAATFVVPALYYLAVRINQDGAGYVWFFRKITRGSWNHAREIKITNGRAADEWTSLRYPRDRRRILKCEANLSAASTAP